MYFLIAILFDCGDLPSILNGAIDLTEGTLEGDTARYSCDDQYFLVGDEERMCTSSGWSGSEPECRRKIKMQINDMNFNDKQTAPTNYNALSFLFLHCLDHVRSYINKPVLSSFPSNSQVVYQWTLWK